MTNVMDRVLRLAYANPQGVVFAGTNDLGGRVVRVAAPTLKGLARRGLVDLSLSPDGGMMARITRAGISRCGGGQRADRLVLTSAEGRDLGGWCRGAVRDRIADAIRARAEAVRRGEG